MKRRNTVKTFLAILLSFCLIWSASQDQATGYSAYLEQFKTAQSYYDLATGIGASDDYDEEKEARLNRKALDEFRDLLGKIPSTNTSLDSIRFLAAFRTGELEHYFEQFKNALDAYHYSIEVQKKSRLADSLLFKPYLYAGIIYYNQNKYDSATSYFNHAELILDKYGNALEEKERLYNLLGMIHYQQGDYRHAGNYFQKALETLSPLHPYKEALSINYRINLAQIHFQLENFNEANRIYQQLLKEPSNEGLLNEIHHNMGSINLNLGAPSKALEHFRKVNYSSNKKIRLCNSYGIAFMDLEMYDSAAYYFDSAAKLHRQFGINTDPVAHGLTLKHQGDLMRVHGQPSAALKNYQKAILHFYPSFKDSSVKANPAKFSGIFSYINLFNVLVDKAGAFHELYQKEKNIEWAQEELSAYQSAFNLLGYVERTYNSDESRLFLDRTKYVVHSKPIDIAFQLYQRTGNKKYLEALYVFDQQNKASILALQHHSRQNIRGQDSLLLRNENNKRSEISRLTIKAAHTMDSAQLKDINTQVRDLEIELGEIQEELNKHMAYSPRIPSTHHIQKDLLEQRSALLSYHLSDSLLTTIIITKTDLKVYQQELFAGFHEEVRDYISQLKLTGGNTASSKKLFSFLFQHIPISAIDRLIIIPDDELNYLPFETLQNDKGEYLLANCAVQYQYASSLLIKEEMDLDGHQSLTFSPFVNQAYQDSTLQLDKLPHTAKEIEFIKGKKFIGPEATRQNFLDHVQDHKVIHLATHAQSNTRDASLSFIAFYPGEEKLRERFLLYSEEIYNLPLDNAELVILSACETGTGNLVRGEGIMSLSRAFYYAGCTNIITSLWNANDFSTAYITGRFHQYLDKDLSIDMALRQAKLDYLEDESVNPRLKHPYYWSHLVFIGNYEPGDKGFKWWWVVVAGATIGVIVMLKRMRRV